MYLHTFVFTHICIYIHTKGQAAAPIAQHSSSSGSKVNTNSSKPRIRSKAVSTFLGVSARKRYDYLVRQGVSKEEVLLKAYIPIPVEQNKENRGSDGNWQVPAMARGLGLMAAPQNRPSKGLGDLVSQSHRRSRLCAVHQKPRCRPKIPLDNLVTNGIRIDIVALDYPDTLLNMEQRNACNRT